MKGPLCMGWLSALCQAGYQPPLSHYNRPPAQAPPAPLRPTRAVCSGRGKIDAKRNGLARVCQNPYIFFQSPVTPCTGLEFQRRMRKSQGKEGIWTVATRVKKQRQRSERDVSTEAPGLSPQGKEFWASTDSITPLQPAGAMGTATVPRHGTVSLSGVAVAAFLLSLWSIPPCDGEHRLRRVLGTHCAKMKAKWIENQRTWKQRCL